MSKLPEASLAADAAPAVHERSRVASRLQLTARDQRLLADLVRYGALTEEQLARRHFASSTTAAQRIRALRRAGYIQVQRSWYGQPSICLATQHGAQLADAGLPACRVSYGTVRHQLCVANLADWLLRQHPGSTWTTERELRREAMIAAQEAGSGRLVDGIPHVPDGLLVLPAERWAVEVELSTKSSGAYERILRWYALAPGYHRLMWYVASPALQARLQTITLRYGLEDLMGVDLLPAHVEVPAWD